VDELSRMLTRAFTAPPSRNAKRIAERIRCTVTPYHFQVYTQGGEYGNRPAYVGNDRAEADRIAVEVGGYVDVVPWRL
jgi:hypothetical protein